MKGIAYCNSLTLRIGTEPYTVSALNLTTADRTFREATGRANQNPFVPPPSIVEDDPMQREMIGLLLEESDVEVIECESAEAPNWC